MRICSLVFLYISLIFASCSKTSAQNKPSPPPLYRIVQDNLYGFIDSTGAVRIAPSYVNAQHFSEGLAAVRENGYYGYINTRGQYVLPPTYDYAMPFVQGKAFVWIGGVCYKTDRFGSKTAFQPPKNKKSQLDIERWQISQNLNEEAKSIGYSNITGVYKNRRFASRNSYDWILIDAGGKCMGNSTFNEVVGLEEAPQEWDKVWEDGRAIVKIGNQIGAIDLDGKFILPLRSFDFEVRNISRWGHYLVLTTRAELGSDSPLIAGIWDMANNTLIGPKFDEIDAQALLHGGLIAVTENKRLKYITPSGKYVWEEKEPRDTLPKGLNVDYMVRGFFYAASPEKEEFNGYGGWGGSGNYARKITSKEPFESGKVQLVAFPSQHKVFRETFDGFRLALANTSNDTLVLDAQDSRIYLSLQALDPKENTWRDIMYQPSSWCGNSYHKVFLAPGEYWDFVSPVMDGGIKTTLRFRLYDSSKNKQEFISNTFEGSINPAQFWRKEGYSASGIMDPYDD